MLEEKHKAFLCTAKLSVRSMHFKMYFAKFSSIVCTLENFATLIVHLGSPIVCI